MSDWSDTPPTVDGYYWLKHRHGLPDSIGGFSGYNWTIGASFVSPSHVAERYQFGSRIPSNAELLAMRRELGEAKFTEASLSKLTDLLSTLSEKQAAQIAELHRQIATLTEERNAAEQAWADVTRLRLDELDSEVA